MCICLQHNFLHLFVSFVSYLLLGTSFYYWTKHIRLTKSNAAAKVLDSELYILNAHLRKPLIDLRFECVEAGKWPVGKWDGKTTYSLEGFVGVQGAPAVGELQCRFRICHSRDVRFVCARVLIIGNVSCVL